MNTRDAHRLERILRSLDMPAVDKILVYRPEAPDFVVQRYFEEGCRYVLHVITRRTGSFEKAMALDRRIRELCLQFPKSLAVIETCRKKLPVGATLVFASGKRL